MHPHSGSGKSLEVPGSTTPPDRINDPTFSTLISEFGSDIFGLDICGGYSQPTIICYKQGCRKRTPKGAQNAEFRQSRSRRQALGDATAFEKHDPRLAEENASALEDLRDDKCIVAKNVSNQLASDPGNTMNGCHNYEKELPNLEQGAPDPTKP